MNKIREKYFIQEIAIGKGFQNEIDFRTKGFHHFHEWKVDFLKEY